MYGDGSYETVESEPGGSLEVRARALERGRARATLYARLPSLIRPRPPQLDVPSGGSWTADGPGAGVDLAWAHGVGPLKVDNVAIICDSRCSARHQPAAMKQIRDSAIARGRARPVDKPTAFPQLMSTINFKMTKLDKSDGVVFCLGVYGRLVVSGELEHEEGIDETEQMRRAGEAVGGKCHASHEIFMTVCCGMLAPWQCSRGRRSR